jgi:uncharacterized protein (DUF1800 family)
MANPRARRPSIFVLLVVTSLFATLVVGAPGEVQDVQLVDPSTLSWSATAGADSYNVYRGALSDLFSGVPARCHGFEIAATNFTSATAPDPGTAFVYLVTAESEIDGEGTAGVDSNSQARALLGACRPVMRTHLLDRAGYGWNDYAQARIAAVGLDGYLAEQLDPHFISEVDNFPLNDRLGPITPPADIFHLLQHQIIRAVYARRQLEQQVTTFWTNHFNTYWLKSRDLLQGAFPPCETPGNPPQCDPDYPARNYQEATNGLWWEMQDFRVLAFYGNFRQILEASAFSPAMILFLDTYASVNGNPNENYPRELLELYSMGVDGGYTQTDVEELARVFTGINLCKKAPADVDDLLAPCLGEYWDDEVPGKIVATLVLPQHDCTEKTLFAGEPEQATIPDTCSNPSLGVQDFDLALDAIAAHPSTARFISKKLLQRFVTDTPDETLIDALVAEWNDTGNPRGVGDLRALLEATLMLDAFSDPDGVRSKIKTPLEHMSSAIRATRGRTDGLDTVISFLAATQHIPHYNPVPTGWAEDGDSWINTNAVLDRQNFGFTLLTSTNFGFGADPIALLNDNGVSSAPGNAEAIVDFFADVLFGGALTPAERQAAIQFLNTDNAGSPSPYNDARIRDTVALLLGYPQFQEQ